MQMLRKINGLLALIIIGIGVYRLIDKDYEVNPKFILPLLSIMFLLFSIEAFMNKRKLIASLYLVVFVITVSASFLILTQA
jgi:NhaP-type Na+/H+ or K+/H+ antiporter